MSRSPVEVRPAASDDVEAVLALSVQVAAEGRFIGRELPMDLAVGRQRFLDSVGSSEHLALVAVDTADQEATGSPGAVVGHLHLGVAPYGVAELGMLVASGHRRQGVGGNLLDAALAWSADRPDVHKVALQVWPHNSAAVALYLSRGFEQEGLLRSHYRRRSGELWDAVVMGRLL